jgi:hypothetical protein
MKTPFGVLYSTNIMPDPETGIGTWSEAAFARAMCEGVARDGSHLFPAVPHNHFTKLSDDVRAGALRLFHDEGTGSCPRTDKWTAIPTQHPCPSSGLEIAVLQEAGFNPILLKAPNGIAALIWQKG